MESFTAYHFASDGESLGSRLLEASQLSPRWLAVCSELLADNGPVFECSMGSTLEHYRIKCTAGIVHFSVSNAPALFAAIVPDQPHVQAEAVLTTFATHVGALTPVKQQCPDVASFQRAIAAIPERPAYVVLNWFNAEVPEPDQEAIFQLSLHFAAAYLRWGAVQQAVQGDGPASGGPAP